MKTKNYFKRVIIMTLIASVAISGIPNVAYAKTTIPGLGCAQCGTRTLKWEKKQLTVDTTVIDPYKCSQPTLYTSDGKLVPDTALVQLACYDMNKKKIWEYPACTAHITKKDRKNKKFNKRVAIVNNDKTFSKVKYAAPYHQILSDSEEVGSWGYPDIRFCQVNKGSQSNY